MGDGKYSKISNIRTALHNCIGLISGDYMRPLPNNRSLYRD